MSALTREAYEAAVAKMRLVEGGEVGEWDFDGEEISTDPHPYRYAKLSVSVAPEAAPAEAGGLVALAIELRASFSMFAHRDGKSVDFDLAVSRHLEEAEIAAMGKKEAAHAG